MVNVAILGFGVVGSGVAEILTNNKELIEKRTGSAIQIKSILDLREFPGNPFESLIVHDFKQIVEDPDISIVAEMMGGSHPAYEFTKACLEAGMSVVTSNKEVVANYGVELTQLAAKHHVNYLFEASVGGGIPIIRPILNDLAANHFCSVSGILNGTTNYILTQMKENGMSYTDALSNAQKLGYAEKNPAADVEGLDAARKIVILAALAFGKMIQPAVIHTEGITNITTADMELAQALGCSIKLIGYATSQNGKVLTMVSPRLVPLAEPLATVEDVYNGIMVQTDMLGTAMFYGRGAGKLPTASAVVADIIDCIRTPQGAATIQWSNACDDDILPFGLYKCRHCLLFKGSSDDISKIDTVFHPESCLILQGHIVVTTEVMSENEVANAISSIDLPLVKQFRYLG